MAVLASLFRVFIDLQIILAVLIFLPGIPPKATYSSYTLEPPLEFEGPLSINTQLDDGERLFEGKINGPESIASRKPNEIFVSLHGGKIMKIFGEQFEQTKIITSIGPGCAGPWEEEICGRPLGLRFDQQGKLLVADAYLGIFSLNVDTGEKVLLVNSSIPINGTLPMIIDDLDITDDGDIYFSDASTICNLANGVTELLADPTGRLLKYNVATKATSLVLPNLHFANGVQLSSDQSFVLVAETFRNRITRYWIKGPNAGKSDVFVDRLPGMPDNIRAKPDGGFWISLVTVHKETKFMAVTSKLRVLPLVRKLLSRLLTLTRMIFEAVNSIYPNEHAAKVAFNILNLGPTAAFYDHNQCVIVEVDETGKIVGSLQGVTGLINHISETHQTGNHIFFGSPYNNYLGYLSLDPFSEKMGDVLEMEPIRITIGGDKPAGGKVEL